MTKKKTPKKSDQEETANNILGILDYGGYLKKYSEDQWNEMLHFVQEELEIAIKSYK